MKILKYLYVDYGVNYYFLYVDFESIMV